MPTNRKPLQRRRRALPTADVLWKAGQYIEAVARDPLVEFKYHDHVLTGAEYSAAVDLRAEWEAAATKRRRARS
jgi:hypothetical protein